VSGRNGLMYPNAGNGKMVIPVLPPTASPLRCSVCGAVKKQFDRNDDMVVERDGYSARGTWYSPNGHANSGVLTRFQ
jgi:hypothetical protein